MKTVSFELENGYISRWHEVNEQIATIFENATNLPVSPDDKDGNKALRHFSDNYYDYKFIDGVLVYDANNHGANRIAKQQADKMRIMELKAQLQPLNEDMLQVMAGAIIPNIVEKKAQFMLILNEIRALEDKSLRQVTLQ